MTLRKFMPHWDRLTQLPRPSLLIGGGTIAALAAVATIGLVHAKEARKSTRLAGLEISQDATSYTITIPDAENARARLRGKTLQVTSRDQATGLRSEQNLSLPDADLSQSPEVTKDKGALVVTIPKQNQSALRPSFASSFRPGSVFDQDIFARMEEMQRRMDEMFNHAFGGLDDLPGLPAWDSAFTAGSSPGLNLEDKDGNYVVRANVPGTDAKNLNVSVEQDRILTITTKQEDRAAGRHAVSNSTQVFTLPGPVQSAKMKIDHEDGAFVITLPKA
jgi:HSP20 family protein